MIPNIHTYNEAVKGKTVENQLIHHKPSSLRADAYEEDLSLLDNAQQRCNTSEILNKFSEKPTFWVISQNASELRISMKFGW